MIATYDWFGYDLPDRERYRLIRESGFDGVLLWWSEGFGRGDYKSGALMAKEAGLLIENIHTPIEQQDDFWLDNLSGQAVTDCYLQCISDCAEFGIPAMVVHLPEDAVLYNAVGLDRVKRIADKAECLGVNVALENLRNIRHLSYILDHVDSCRIGFCYDSCHHLNWSSEMDLLKLYGTRMMALHLHDNGGVRAQHQRFRLTAKQTGSL